MPDTLPELYPLSLRPALHAKAWGGRKLQTQLNKMLPDNEPYGEAWELHESAIVDNGPLEGATLAEVLAMYGTELIGEHNDPAEGIPLLAKFLDSSRWLSVQVHPNDAQAAEIEGEPRGKSEAWYIISAEPESRLVIGVKPGTSREALAAAVEAGTLSDLLEYAPVKAGDLLYNPANGIHAMGPGIIAYEIQQSSDTTYRLFDWNNLGLDGKPRELHIDKGLRVANPDLLPEVLHPADEPISTLIDSDYFQLMRYILDGDNLAFSPNGIFQIFTCIGGMVMIADDTWTVSSELGETVLIPACLKQYRISGKGKLLRAYQTVRTS